MVDQGSSLKRSRSVREAFASIRKSVRKRSRVSRRSRVPAPSPRPPGPRTRPRAPNPSPSPRPPPWPPAPARPQPGGPVHGPEPSFQPPSQPPSPSPSPRPPSRPRPPSPQPPLPSPVRPPPRPQLLAPAPSPHKPPASTGSTGTGPAQDLLPLAGVAGSASAGPAACAGSSRKRWEPPLVYIIGFGKLAEALSGYLTPADLHQLQAVHWWIASDLRWYVLGPPTPANK